MLLFFIQVEERVLEKALRTISYIAIASLMLMSSCVADDITETMKEAMASYKKDHA